MRDMQYAINLIIWATLPKLPHYRLSPKEHEEPKKKLMN